MESALDKSDGLLDLAEVLHRLGDEFRRAQLIDEPTIAWNSAEVELESVVEKSKDGSLKFYVVEAGADVIHRSTMRVRVSISPYGRESAAVGM